ncbi:MAG: hypothetical protein U9Q92_06045 [archaeon]|nr:hypothetical protein [archaeon]
MAGKFEAVKENMYGLLKYSKEEYDEYKSTNNVVLLQLAGEKLFNILGYYIQYQSQIQVNSFVEIKTLAKEKALHKLLYSARNLHRFFYYGTDEMNTEDADELYLEVYQEVKSRIGRIDKPNV